MNIRTAHGSIVTLGTSDRGHTTLEISGGEVSSTEDAGSTACDEDDLRWILETLELDPENCVALGKELLHHGVRNSPQMTEALAGHLVSDMLVWIAAALFRRDSLCEAIQEQTELLEKGFLNNGLTEPEAT